MYLSPLVLNNVLIPFNTPLILHFNALMESVLWLLLESCCFRQRSRTKYQQTVKKHAMSS